MSKLEKNQRELELSDGKKYICTFPVITKRQAMRADWLVKGLAAAFVNGDMTEKVYLDTVEPCARLLLNGLNIANEEFTIDIEDFDEQEFFVGRMDDLVIILHAAAEAMGLSKAARKKPDSDAATKATGPTPLTGSDTK